MSKNWKDKNDKKQSKRERERRSHLRERKTFGGLDKAFGYKDEE